MYKYIKLGFVKRKDSFSLIGDWLLVVFQITCHFCFNFLRPYRWVHTEILNVKMKIYKSFSLLKHVRRILALEDDLIPKEFCIAGRREFMLRFFNELEDLCHRITFLMVILFKLMVSMFRTVN